MFMTFKSDANKINFISTSPPACGSFFLCLCRIVGFDIAFDRCLWIFIPPAGNAGIKFKLS